MADIFVTTLNDEIDGIEVGGVSLREVMIAEATGGDHTIFASSLANGTITLTNGELIMDKDLKIDGDTGSSPVPYSITVDTASSSHIFSISDHAEATFPNVMIDELTITGGVTASNAIVEEQHISVFAIVILVSILALVVAEVLEIILEG